MCFDPDQSNTPPCQPFAAPALHGRETAESRQALLKKNRFASLRKDGARLRDFSHPLLVRAAFLPRSKKRTLNIRVRGSAGNQAGLRNEL